VKKPFLGKHDVTSSTGASTRKTMTVGFAAERVGRFGINLIY
jgi:hypothetical protein